MASRTPRFDAAPIRESSHGVPGRFKNESSSTSMSALRSKQKKGSTFHRLAGRRTSASTSGGAAVSLRPGLGYTGTPTRESAMPRMVKCAKLGKELPGLDFKPWNNELGQRIYDSISQDAWKMWLEHFKMVMNEYRLAGGSEQANQVLFDPAQQFLFGEGAPLPPDSNPPPAKRVKHPRAR